MEGATGMRKGCNPGAASAMQKREEQEHLERLVTGFCFLQRHCTLQTQVRTREGFMCPEDVEIE